MDEVGGKSPSFTWERVVEIFLLNFFGRGVSKFDKIAISVFILKIAENDPFLRLQMRAKEDFNSHQLLCTICKG